MLFDPELRRRVREDPARALPELPPPLARALAAVDPRAWKLDRLLVRRTLGTLFAEFKASTTLFLAQKRKLVALESFFASPEFAGAVGGQRPLALAYADFLGEHCSPIERALAEARRTSAPVADGRVHRAEGVVPVATTGGALATLQEVERYLFELGLIPPLALCDDAPPLLLGRGTRDGTPLYLVTVPSESGHSLVTIDPKLHGLLASLPRPDHPELAELVEDELAVRT
jgi:hypothetical protein